MFEGSVESEVRRFIAGRISAGETIVVDWLTHEIVANRSAMHGDDEEFYRVCAYAHVRNVVKKCVGKFKPNKYGVSEYQLTMDGFSHLQEAYTVNLGGDITLVPTPQLPDADLLERAAEYDRMAVGCRQHAAELREYVRRRSAAA